MNFMSHRLDRLLYRHRQRCPTGFRRRDLAMQRLEGRWLLASDMMIVENPASNETGENSVTFESTNDATWGDGDFTGDESVTAADLNALALNWQHGIPAAAPTGRMPRAPLRASRASLGGNTLPFDFPLDSWRGGTGDNSSTGGPDENIDDPTDEGAVDAPDYFTPADADRGLPIDKNPANDDEWMFLELVDDFLERWPDSP